MVVSDQLKKQIIIEILALLFLIGVIVYAWFAIHKSNQTNVTSQEGMVIVVDDEKMKTLEKHSDGESKDIIGAKYTVTNNNKGTIEYDLIVIPDTIDEDIIDNIKISVDELYISSLNELPRKEGGYIISSYSLKPGYTKIHLIKAWYKLNTPDDVLKNQFGFKYRLITKK